LSVIETETETETETEREAGGTKEEGALPNGRASIDSVASDERRPGAKGSRTRTCVGCGERVEVTARVSLVRLILGPEGEVAVDPGDGGFGRGAHVHPRPDCLAKAVQRGLAKAAKGRVHSVSSGEGELAPLRPDTLAAAIKAAMDRRVEGLLAAAVRSRQVALGADAVTGACARGEAALVVVACDAAAAADLAEVRRAISEGRAVSWGTKLSLGALFGGGEAARPSGVGVVALTSSRIGAAVREAIHIADGSVGRAMPDASQTSAEARGGGSAATRAAKKPAKREEPAEKAGARASGGPRNGPPRHDSRHDLRKDHRGARKGAPGRAGKASLGVAAGAAASRRVDR
jgi:predicted RNA-binding protein YlxR (DUF448 family)/ribosomal protein L7Ae-like RNA K-turn-binding protein